MENRRHQRFPLQLPFELLTGEDRIRTQGETRNVSSCGVLFSAETPVGIGTPIEYFITLPRVMNSKIEVRVRCMGTVVREEPNEQGATFAATLERYEFVRNRL